MTPDDMHIRRMTRDELKGAANTSNNALAQLEPKVKWEHSYVTADKTFCIYSAENEDVIDALDLPVDDLGAEFPEFRHPKRPEFLLTLPHVHGTSGFFIARLRRP